MTGNPRVLSTCVMFAVAVAIPSAGAGAEPARPTQAEAGAGRSAASNGQNAAAAQLAKTFADSWNRRDGRAYGDAYWPDAELVDPSGLVWNGRQAIIGTHRELWSGAAKATHMTARVRRVRSLGPDIFVVDIDTSATGFSPPPPGAPDGVVRTRLKHVVERRHGQWKILASQNTFVAGAPGRR